MYKNSKEKVFDCEAVLGRNLLLGWFWL